MLEGARFQLRTQGIGECDARWAWLPGKAQVALGGEAEGAWPWRGDALGGGAGRGHARGLRDRRREGAGLPLSAAILATAEAGGFP